MEIFLLEQLFKENNIKSKDRDRSSNSLLRQGPSLKDNL